jgi:hypothetical protein
MTLTKSQFDWLATLHRYGGTATLERGAVSLGGSRCPNASCISFLNLIVKGALEGKNGKLQITPYGYRILNVPEQGISAADCESHKLEVGGSSPPPATNSDPIAIIERLGFGDQPE